MVIQKHNDTELRMPATKQTMQNIVTATELLRLIPPRRNRSIVLSSDATKRLRCVVRRTLAEIADVEKYMCPVPGGPGCKLLGVPKVLNVTDDKVFLRKTILMLAEMMYVERDFANQTNVIYAAKMVHYASDKRFLNRVFAPAGYVIADEYTREAVLGDNEDALVFFGTGQLFLVTSWFVFNASLEQRGQLTDLLRELEVEE